MSLSAAFVGSARSWVSILSGRRGREAGDSGNSLVSSAHPSEAVNGRLFGHQRWVVLHARCLEALHLCHVATLVVARALAGRLASDILPIPIVPESLHVAVCCASENGQWSIFKKAKEELSG